MAFGQTDPLERADVAAAEDGRTPLNTYMLLVADPVTGFRFGLGGGRLLSCSWAQLPIFETVCRLRYR